MVSLCVSRFVQQVFSCFDRWEIPFSLSDFLHTHVLNCCRFIWDGWVFWQTAQILCIKMWTRAMEAPVGYVLTKFGLGWFHFAFPFVFHQIALRVSPFLVTRDIPSSLSDFLRVHFSRKLLSVHPRLLHETFLGELTIVRVTSCGLLSRRALPQNSGKLMVGKDREMTRNCL